MKSFSARWIGLRHSRQQGGSWSREALVFPALLCASLWACQAAPTSAPEFETEVTAGPQFWIPAEPDVPTLAFERHGSAGAPVTWLLIHGWCENRRFWNPMVRELLAAEPSGSILCVDLPGHGDSLAADGPSDPGEVAQVMSAWVRDQGLGPVVLVGHNYGATVALEMARRLQDQQTIPGVVVLHALYDPSQAYEPDALELFAQALEANFANEMGAFSNAMLSDDSDPKVRAWVQGQMKQSEPKPAVALLRGLGGFDLRPALKELRMPVRAINGEFRPTRKEAADALLRDFDFVTLPDVPGAGFAPMVHQPKACAEILARLTEQFVAPVDPETTAAPANPQRP